MVFTSCTRAGEIEVLSVRDKSWVGSMRRREQAALFHFELPWSEHGDQEVLLLTWDSNTQTVRAQKCPFCRWNKKKWLPLSALIIAHRLIFSKRWITHLLLLWHSNSKKKRSFVDNIEWCSDDVFSKADPKVSNRKVFWQKQWELSIGFGNIPNKSALWQIHNMILTHSVQQINIHILTTLYDFWSVNTLARS